MITTLRQSSSAGARIDLSCGLRHPMKLVPFATCVRMDVKAFPSRPSVPLLITNSQRKNSILFMTAMKYVCRCTSQHFVLDSNELRHQKICLRWHFQIAFPTVLFFLVTQG
ncbi:hypothetical protein T12_487 [Trichinella patagoniensis]|uniref:Uncharacterized protein n=1 Tax=Trichinella patagoniensis TaxID=990121 RepID=A0A0V0ZN05_9BILA|nr:hypothetical protein T12_487 [Trichinella patagoniensis]